eukprot:15107402-Alexandrium_andersonii.AAC.1
MPKINFIFVPVEDRRARHARDAVVALCAAAPVGASLVGLRAPALSQQGRKSDPLARTPFQPHPLFASEPTACRCASR